MVSKNKILIVDDDGNIAELISLYLAKECFDTQIVGDGESALRAVKTYQPDLILLDLMLPGIDGYQVCREVRASSDIPIIMLSAKGEVFDKVLGLELGADDYMEKPFDSKELVARTKAVLRRYKASAASAVPAEPDGRNGVRSLSVVRAVAITDPVRATLMAPCIHHGAAQHPERAARCLQILIDA